jgi:hypothetical protein
MNMNYYRILIPNCDNIISNMSFEYNRKLPTYIFLVGFLTDCKKLTN